MIAVPIETNVETPSVCLLGGPDAVSQRYAAEGCLSSPFAFDEKLIDAAAEDTRRVIASGKRRAQDLWRRSPAIKALACDAGVLSFLSKLYGRRAFPFQTLSFVKGSEQKPHADTFHFSSTPERMMCGVWIALEKADEENGPLVYYPGSHRLPVYAPADVGGGDYATNYEPFVAAELSKGRFGRKEALMKKGEAFLWSANLFHGGAPIRDCSRTRLSLVTHYFFDDCTYVTPMREKDGKAHTREVYDIAAGRFVRQKRNGAVVRPSPIVALAARYRNLTRQAPVS